MLDARAAATLRVSRILWGALLASMAIYVVIANVIVNAPGSKVPIPELANAPASNPLFLGLAFMAVVELAAGTFMRARMMPARRKTDTSPRDIDKALGRLRVAQLIGWALCEAVAINGLILTMLSHEMMFSLGFTAVGALAMVSQAPSERILDEVVRAASPD